jgi:hypothetical protein
MSLAQRFLACGIEQYDFPKFSLMSQIDLQGKARTFGLATLVHGETSDAGD